ncbi:MAG: glycosyltransferase family 2 protein [Methylococcales bacterium]|nr:glycosyltransferase family 2 protein [Methylococcales bacterium]
MLYELSIVVPTLNEVGNIELLCNKISNALKEINWEIIFVDDNSADGTQELLNQISSQHPHIRAIHRINRTGLSSACIEGMLASKAPIVAVMDADLQHDETLLPIMFAEFSKKPLDIVVASRFAAGAELGDFSAKRELLSNMGNLLSRLVLKVRLTDPLSGFFMLRKEVLHKLSPRLYGKGFKILLDIFASSKKPLNFIEVPLRFNTRHSGESKLDTTTALEFIGLLCHKLFGKIIPVRFILFSLVGLTGVGVHLLVLTLLHIVINTQFIWSQTIATYIAMTSNYFINNSFTYRDKKLHGKKLLFGLLSFYLVCSVGAFLNVEFASLLYEMHINWAIAGTSGALIGAVLNYALSSMFTWRKTKT